MGLNVGFSDFITACYSTGTVTNSGTGDKGGLVGQGPLTAVRNSYFDYEASGRDDPNENYAKSASDLKSPTDYTDLYAGWNIDIDDGVNPGLEDGSVAGDDTADSPWDFGTDSEYPALSIDFDLRRRRLGR